MRKGFNFIPYEDVLTPVLDQISAFVPDQALPLKDLILQFGYLGSDKLSEVLNRGFIGDEDDDNGGYQPGALDFAEIHDRLDQDLRLVNDYALANHASATLQDQSAAPSDESAAPSDDEEQR